MITERTEVTGSAKGQGSWFTIEHANVSYDHPFHLPWEHALNIDFLNESAGPGARVAVELSPDSARELANAIFKALERGEAVEAAMDAAMSRPS